MQNKFTFLTYFRSKDPEKLNQFIWSLPFKIEIKEIVYAKGKWYCWFNYPDNMHPKGAFINLDVDQM